MLKTKTVDQLEREVVQLLATLSQRALQYNSSDMAWAIALEELHDCTFVLGAAFDVEAVDYILENSTCGELVDLLYGVTIID